MSIPGLVIMIWLCYSYLWFSLMKLSWFHNFFFLQKWWTSRKFFFPKSMNVNKFFFSKSDEHQEFFFSKMNKRAKIFLTKLIFLTKKSFFRKILSLLFIIKTWYNSYKNVLNAMELYELCQENSPNEDKHTYQCKPQIASPK